MNKKLSLLAVMLCIGMLCYGQNKEVPSKNSENDQTQGRIALRIQGNNHFMTILIGFIPEGTENYDEGYDSNFVNEGAALEFYSFLDTSKLSIQALPELISENREVALGCEITSEGVYTISIDAEFLNPEFEILLEDSELGLFTDLRTTNYSFVSNRGELHDRFKLRLIHQSALSVETYANQTPKIHAYFSNYSLNIHTNSKTLQSVTLYTLTGKKLGSFPFQKQITTKQLSKGVYIIECKDTSGKKIIKKITK